MQSNYLANMNIEIPLW